MKLKIFLSVALFCLTTIVKAQETKSSCSFYTAFTDPETKKVIYRTAEEMPQFENSEQDIRSYMNESIQKYVEKCISSSVTMSFIVEPDGSITGIKVFADNQCPTEEELLQIIDQLPALKPGIIKGAKIPVYMKFEFVIPDMQLNTF